MHDFTPQRIVSLQPSATHILDCLGLGERIVACTRHCLQLCPQLSDRMLLKDSWSAESGEIIAARPDLVIAAVPFQSAAVIEILKAGVRLLALAPRKLADIYGDISVLAHLFGCAEQGENVITAMQAEIEAVRGAVRGLGGRTVYCEEWGKPMLRSQPWVAELVEAAGGVFLGVPGAPASAEEVAAADPETMVFAWCGAGDRVPLGKLVKERHWGELHAVRSGRVYCIRDEFLTTPAPVLTRGLQALAAALHPEIFKSAEGLRDIRMPPNGGDSPHSLAV